MFVAIPTFADRVAPRIEGAPQLRVVDLEDHEAEPEVLPGLVIGLGPWLDSLTNAGVQWVVCGAVPPFLFSALSARGIRVMMGVAGEFDEVVRALREGRLQLGAQVPFSVWPAPGPRGGRWCGLGPFGPRRGFRRRGGRGPGGGPAGGGAGPGLTGRRP